MDGMEWSIVRNRQKHAWEAKVHGERFNIDIYEV